MKKEKQEAGIKEQLQTQQRVIEQQRLTLHALWQQARLQFAPLIVRLYSPTYNRPGSLRIEHIAEEEQEKLEQELKNSIINKVKKCLK